MRTSTFKSLFGVILTGLLCAVSCSEGGDDTVAPDGKPYEMELAVTTRGDGSQADKEQKIHSLYIYAFDDTYITSPDTYAEENINKGVGANAAYSLKMGIRREGIKRFYVFANPPEYIRTELKHKVTEEFLRSLSLFMYRPAFTVEEIPQTVDGLSGPQGKPHFPMANAFEAHVRKIADSYHVALFPDAKTDATLDPTAIKSIPLFRSFGKISVEAYLKGYTVGSGVSIEQLEIFNYGGEGYALPYWSGRDKFWIVDGPNAVWNPMKVMELEKMAERETKVLTTPFKLLKSPVILTQPAGDVAVLSPVTEFYLSQNSYGQPTSVEDTQSGLVDEVGNRETRMVVYLSDGRVSEMVLPFLRRNDKLRVRLAISEFGLNVNFKVWNTSNVNPDWDEEIRPSIN